MLLRLFRQGTTGKQRFSQLFWMCQMDAIFNSYGSESGKFETCRLLLFDNNGRAFINEIETVVRVRVVLIQPINPQDPQRDQSFVGGSGSTDHRLSRPIYFE